MANFITYLNIKLAVSFQMSVCVMGGGGAYMPLNIVIFIQVNIIKISMIYLVDHFQSYWIKLKEI